MKNFHIKYKFKRQNGVVYRIETESLSVDVNGDRVEEYHAASLIAMQTLMLLDKEHIVAGEKLMNYHIIWED